MTDGSVTRWIGQLKEGGESDAHQELWDRFFSRLAALARRQLGDLPAHLRDDEDVALSALNSFFTRAGQNLFSQLHDRNDLWQLLAKITARKAVSRRRRALAQKRGGGRTVAVSDLSAEVQDFVDHEPTPDQLAALNEQCHRLLAALDDELRTLAVMKLQGYANREIAEQLGRVERTVERKLERVRHAWLREVEQA
ncbi:MAG: RNA polymerase subunit sigma-70 [Planctomycetaceae bacterium]|nr:RNA polymerase subunit sigma-70 [Planctomycetaceae bacterium]